MINIQHQQGDNHVGQFNDKQKESEKKREKKKT